MAQILSSENPFPSIDSRAVLQWYDRHARILPWRVSPQGRRAGERPDPYFVWLSEIMLQQTTIAAVGRYFAAFTSLWPTVDDLADAPLDDVLVQWAGLGYYARARNLHACAIKVSRDHGGVFPATAEALKTLPGIGDYTAAAIAAICHDEPVAVIDGNVDRVAARFFALPTPVRETKPFIREKVQQAVPPRAGDFAQAMMDLGATICAPRHANCLICPLSPDCLGTRTGNPEAFPIPPEKPQRPVRHGHAFIITDGAGRVFLRQRGPKGLLAKMTEVPNSNWGPQSMAPQFPYPANWRNAGRVEHTFTHFHLGLDIWRTDGAPPLDEGWWADETLLANQALPSLFRKVLKAGGIG